MFQKYMTALWEMDFRENGIRVISLEVAMQRSSQEMLMAQGRVEQWRRNGHCDSLKIELPGSATELWGMKEVNQPRITPRFCFELTGEW